MIVLHVFPTNWIKYVSKPDLHDRPLHAGIHPREVGFRGVCQKELVSQLTWTLIFCFIDTRYMQGVKGGSSDLRI